MYHRISLPTFVRAMNMHILIGESRQQQQQLWVLFDINDDSVECFAVLIGKFQGIKQLIIWIKNNQIYLSHEKWL